jgi:hypothetical protein
MLGTRRRALLRSTLIAPPSAESRRLGIAFGGLSLRTVARSATCSNSVATLPNFVRRTTESSERANHSNSKVYIYPFLRYPSVRIPRIWIPNRPDRCEKAEKSYGKKHNSESSHGHSTGLANE